VNFSSLSPHFHLHLYWGVVNLLVTSFYKHVSGLEYRVDFFFIIKLTSFLGFPFVSNLGKYLITIGESIETVYNSSGYNLLVYIYSTLYLSFLTK